MNTLVNVPSDQAVAVSLIILLDEEAPAFPAYAKTLADALANLGRPAELLIIANGTGAFLRRCLPALERNHPACNALEFQRKTTQAACIQATLSEVRGAWLVICGPRQQVSTASLGRIFASIDTGVDVISPWRQRRTDPALGRFRSWLFHAVTRIASGTRLHDLGCHPKVCRRRVLDETPLYGNLYHFLPILAVHKGFKVREVPCEPHSLPDRIDAPGLRGCTTRCIDILTLYFNTRFTKKPLRFFSAIGLGFLLVGVFLTLYLFVDKILSAEAIGNRPLLFIAILLMVLGVQSASVGLLGEIITFAHGRKQREYTVEKEI